MSKRRASAHHKNEPFETTKKRGNGKKTLSTISILLLLAAVFVFAIIVAPKKPIQRAVGTIGTDEAGNFVPSGAYQGLVISEVMASNNSAVPDSYGAYSDYVEIWNSSKEDISLQNVGLSDRTDKVLFIFPNISLPADGRVIVYASGRNDTSSPNSLHAKFKISSTKQETIALFDPGQFIISQVTMPVLNANQVYALNQEGFYEVSDYATPGFPNTEEGSLAYRQSKTTAIGTLLINEVMADPLTGITDADGELVDWIEIYNPTNQDIALKNIYLSDDAGKPFKWAFPDNAVIYANKHYVVFCSGKDRIDTNTNVPHSNFRINAEGETIVLSDGLGNVIDRVSFDNLPRDNSYGLGASGQFEIFEIATPGLPNTPEGAARMEEYIRAANPTQVYITEVLASNTQVALHERDKDFGDYVELYNPSTQVVDLSSYGLSDNINRPRKWQFPAGAAIYPGERKIIYLDGSDGQINGEYHTNFKVSQHGGETFTFCDPSGKILDKMHLPAIRSNYSYGRSEGRGGFFYYKNPSPRAENGEGFNGFAQEPAFSIRGGVYEKAISLSLTVPDGTTVYYTTNGDTPTQESTLYDGKPLSLNRPTVIRAKAFSTNPLIEESTTVTQSYILGMPHSLPVVSLVADNFELYDPTSGMLSNKVLNKETGELSEVPADSGIPFKNTVYRLMKGTWRPGHVEVYSLDNNQTVSQNIKFTLQGDFSLDYPQKSFKIKAVASQGERYFDSSLFDDLPFTQYKGFVLRTSGNDNAWTRLNDGFQSRLIDMLDTTVLNQAWNPVAVYLNGEYWGHYNMRERIDRYFVAQHEGLPLEEADNMDLLQGNSTVKHGSNKEYRDMIEKVKELSPGKNPEDLQYILDNIDVDNYFDYMAVEMFFGNSDPGNIRFYKLDGEGQKWKWIFYDMDYGLFNSNFDSPWSYLKPEGAGQNKFDNTLIRKLLENEEMKDKFLTRLGEIFQMYTTDTMIALLDEMKAMIEPEMSAHFIRWAEYTDKRISFDNPSTPEGALRYWSDRIEVRQKNVLKKRPTLFYDMVQKEFKLTDEQMVHYFGPQPPMPEGVV